MIQVLTDMPRSLNGVSWRIKIFAPTKRTNVVFSRTVDNFVVLVADAKFSKQAKGE